MTVRRFSLLLAILLPALLWGQQFTPPTEFTTGYQFPRMTTPSPRAEWFAVLDIALLVLALALAAYFALYRRSRRGLFGLTIASLAYFGFYRKGCICAVGAIQNVALALGDTGHVLPLAVAAFFLLPLLFTLFFGRVFCAAVCPLGAIQEVVLLRPVKVPAWLAQALKPLPHVVLTAAVLFAAAGGTFLLCRYDPFVGFFRLSAGTVMLGVGAGMLLLSVVVGRPYCRFLCPYGALLRLLAPFARWQVSITPDDCTACHLCADACPYGAIKAPLPARTLPRREGKRLLIQLVVLLPVFIVLAGWLGYQGSDVVAQAHPTVRLADQLWIEAAQPQTPRTEASEAYYTLGLPPEDAYREALALRARFRLGVPLAAGWLALVIGLQLIGLTVRRHRDTYEADPAACLACGRCYRACPYERSRAQAPRTAPETEAVP